LYTEANKKETGMSEKRTQKEIEGEMDYCEFEIADIKRDMAWASKFEKVPDDYHTRDLYEFIEDMENRMDKLEDRLTRLWKESVGMGSLA